MNSLKPCTVLFFGIIIFFTAATAVPQTGNEDQGADIDLGGYYVNLTGQEVRAVLKFVNEANVCELDRVPGIGSVGAQRIIDFRPYESVEHLVSLPNVGARKVLILVAHTSSLGAKSWVFDAELGLPNDCATEPKDGPGCAVLWQWSGTWDLCITRVEETRLLKMFNDASGYFLDEIIGLSEMTVADILASRPFSDVGEIGTVYRFGEIDAAKSLALLRSYPQLD